MVAFDLSGFASRAFGGDRLPDHPLRTQQEAAAAMKQLEGEPGDSALAQITYYVKSMNDTHSFTPGRRAVVLLRLHEASRLYWGELAARYLTSRGKPNEGRDGDPNVLRALFDSASEFVTGFGISIDDAAHSKWVQANVGGLAVRKMRWLGRRLVLAHMLRLPGLPAIWDALHRLYALAEQQNAARQPQPVFEAARFPSCARQEYIRAALLELAAPQSLSPREVELAYRMAGRVAAKVRLERQPGPGRHPLPAGAPGRLYLDAQNALVGLQAEEKAQGNPKGADPLYGNDFTVRERVAMVRHLLQHWGAAPPRRRAQRVALSASAEILYTFDSIARALPSAEQEAPSAASGSLSIIDQTGKLQREAMARPSAAFAARVIDASSGGLGLAVQGSPAWLKHGTLVAVRVERNPEWMIATVRRIFAPAEKERRIGLQILSAHPRRFTFQGGDLNTVWEEAARQEIRSSETSRHGILLYPEGFARTRGELLLPAGAAAKNKRLDVRSRGSLRQVQLTRIDDDGAQYDRVAYELLPASAVA